MVSYRIVSLYISLCNNNRNKVDDKCNVLESSPNHQSNLSVQEKLSSTNSVTGAKMVGDH